MLAEAREWLANLVEGPDGSPRRRHVAIAVLATIIVASTAWGIYRGFFREIPELKAGNYVHFICTKCGHVMKLERAAMDRKTRIDMELGGPLPLDCSSCRAARAAAPARECPKCGKPFLWQRSGSRPECPHCSGKHAAAAENEP